MKAYDLFTGTRYSFEILDLEHFVQLFIYVKRGTVFVDQINQCMMIRQGQAAVIPDVEQLRSNDFKGMIIAIDDIDEVNLTKWCGSSITEVFNESFVFMPDSHFLRIFDDLAQIPCCNESAYVKLKALEILLCLENEKNNMLIKDLSNSQMQAAVLAYQKICANCLVKVCDVCNELHVSTSYMQKAFKNMYGVSMTTFIRQRKMEQAAHYLKNTDHSVLDIALSCGYQNPSKFSQAFSKIMGETPLCYRKSHRDHLGSFSN